jgi:hypothetical protein
MKLTAYNIRTLQAKATLYISRGWLVAKPMYVDWLGRYAIKLVKERAP